MWLMVDQQGLTPPPPNPPPPPQRLQSAKEIHQFQHDVDELKSWMAEKEAVLGSEEDQDLHSVQTLLRRHQELQVRRSPSPPTRCGRASHPGGGVKQVPLTLGGGGVGQNVASRLPPCC